MDVLWARYRIHWRIIKRRTDGINTNTHRVTIALWAATTRVSLVISNNLHTGRTTITGRRVKAHTIPRRININ